MKNIRQLALIFLLLITCYLPPTQVSAQTPDTIGSIQYNTGVPSGSPIFTIENFLPGDTNTKTIFAKNIGSAPARASIKVALKSTTANFANILEVTITQNDNPIYGENSPTGTKTLSNFVSDSNSGIFGLPLTIIPSNTETQYKISVSLPTNAGNQYQNARTVFDLLFGITVDIPTGCQNISFDKVLFGTNSGNVINGTSKNELILGFNGFDVVHGGGGNDCIVGGSDNDVLYGDSGNDVILGEFGSDVLFGNAGDDTIFGDTGLDVLFGGAGNDRLDGGPLQDIILGEENTDKCEQNLTFSCELPL